MNNIQYIDNDIREYSSLAEFIKTLTNYNYLFATDCITQNVVMIQDIIEAFYSTWYICRTEKGETFIRKQTELSNFYIVN